MQAAVCLTDALFTGQYLVNSIYLHCRSYSVCLAQKMTIQIPARFAERGTIALIRA